MTLFALLSDLLILALLAGVFWGVSFFFFVDGAKRAGFTIVLSAASMLFMAVSASAHEYPAQVGRIVDADTMDVVIDLDPVPITVPTRLRLMCINAPESRGKNKSDAGVAMSDLVKGMGIREARVELLKLDAFGRYLAWVRPKGWDITLNEWLYRNGAPLYARLTRADRAACVERLGPAP